MFLVDLNNRLVCKVYKIMDSCIFAPVVSQEEWQTIPTEIGKKISKFVNEKFEEFITSKALLETKTSNSGKHFRTS